MPGPRLQARLSNPQPIVTPAGPSALAGFAQLASVGLQAFKTVKAIDAREEEAAQSLVDSTELSYLATFSNKLNEGVAQSQITRAQADAQLTAESNRIITRNPLLTSKVQGIININSQVRADQLSAEVVQRNKAEDDADEYTARLARFLLDESDPMSFNKVTILEGMESNLIQKQLRLDTLKVNRSISVEEIKDLAFDTAKLGITTLSTQWTSLIGGTTDRETGGMQEEDKVAAINAIEGGLRNFEKEYFLKFGKDLDEKTRNEYTAPIRDEAARNIELINSKVTSDVYRLQNVLINHQADSIFASTAEGVAQYRLTMDVANLKDPSFFLSVMSNSKLQKALKTNVGDLISRMTFEPSPVGEALVRDPKINSSITAEILNAFTNNEIEVDGPTVTATANMLSNITKPMDLMPNKFNMDSWDALMLLGASPNGKKLMDNPNFNAAQASISRGMDNYAVKLVKSALRDLPEGSSLSIVEGKMVATLDPREAPREQGVLQSLLNAGVPRDIKINQVAKWNQNYGTRIYTLTQATSNVRGGSNEEHLNVLASQFGITGTITTTPDANELSDEDRVQARMALEAGWYPDIESALADMRAMRAISGE